VACKFKKRSHVPYGEEVRKVKTVLTGNPRSRRAKPATQHRISKPEKSHDRTSVLRDPAFVSSRDSHHFSRDHAVKPENWLEREGLVGLRILLSWRIRSEEEEDGEGRYYAERFHVSHLLS
jgi:hypothetical protein